MFSPLLIESAQGQLRDFYAKSSAQPPFLLEELEKRLVAAGAADDNDLRDMTWEDLEQSLAIPRLQARKLATLFRGGQQQEGPQQHLVVRTTADEVGELTHRELIERYAKHPSALHNAVAEQIRARSRNRPCIAFLEDGSIDVETSTKALEYIQAGDDFGATIRSTDGKPKYVYRLGEGNGDLRDVHPVFAGSALLLDKTDRHGIYWGDISLECRQLIWIAHNETHELRIDQNREALLDLRDRAANGIGVLAERYPNAFRVYEERKTLGGLPAMKTRLKKAS